MTNLIKSTHAISAAICCKITLLTFSGISLNFLFDLECWLNFNQGQICCKCCCQRSMWNSCALLVGADNSKQRLHYESARINGVKRALEHTHKHPRSINIDHSHPFSCVLASRPVHAARPLAAGCVLRKSAAGASDCLPTRAGDQQRPIAPAYIRVHPFV